MIPPEKIVEDNPTNWDEKIRIFSSVISCDCERKQSKAIYEFARQSKLAPDSALITIIPTLVNLLKISLSSTRKSTIFALCRLSRRPGSAFCSIIGQCGAIPIILGFLPSSIDRFFRRSLIRLLSSLVAFDSSNRTTLAKNRGLDVVLELISSRSDDDTRKPLLEILSAMAMLREVRRVVVIDIAALGFLIEAISLGRMISRTQAAHAIGILGIAKRARRILVDLGAIEPLLELIREGDQSARLIAGNALGLISSDVDCICPVAESGAIPLYMEFLKGVDPLGKEMAEDVFCILAVAEEFAVVIVEELVRVLRGCDEEAMSAAVDVLWGLAGYDHSVPVVRDSGAIPLLIEILRNGNGDIRMKVMRTIARLGYEEANRRALAEAGGITLIVDLLNGDSEELRDYAVEALMSFAEDATFRELIVEVYSIPVFVDAMRRLSDELLTSDPGQNPSCITKTW